MPISISDQTKKKIAEELKWRFNFENEDIQDIIEKVISFINEVDQTINPENLESTVQTILKFVYEEQLLLEKKQNKRQG